MALTDLADDVIQTHILTRLDGPSLAAISCTSSHLRATSADQQLWRQICSATWSSVDDSHVRRFISTFPGNYRSFFLDSFPLLEYQPSDRHELYPYEDRLSGLSDLISAVDIYYKDQIVFSKVEKTDTTHRNFLFFPFKIDLQLQREAISIPVQDQEPREIESLVEHLQENLRLSWIVIDPVVNRAGNLSSITPVSIDWPCSNTGDVQLLYSTIIGNRGGSEIEIQSPPVSVECRVVITCSGIYEGEVRVDEASVEIMNSEERCLDGRASLAAVQGALMSRRRWRKGAEKEGYYEEFVKRKKRGEREREKEARGEKLMYTISVSLVTCVALWASLFLFIALYLRFHGGRAVTRVRRYFSDRLQ